MNAEHIHHRSASPVSANRMPVHLRESFNRFSISRALAAVAVAGAAADKQTGLLRLEMGLQPFGDDRGKR